MLAALRGRFPGPDTLRDALLAAWSAPGRHYHGPRHLLAVLDALAGREPAVAYQLAAWFHDAVYDPTRADNEAASARWLLEATAPLVAAGDLDRADVALAARLVLATAQPFDPADAHVRAFLDADFGVFGAPAEVYDAYVAGVRAEYAFVPDELFCAGRRAFLERLRDEVARRGFFFGEATPEAEARARANLARELG